MILAKVLRSFSPATGVIWALRAQSPKKVRKWVPRSSQPRGSKKSKGVEKESKLTIFVDFLDSFSTFSTPGAERPGNPFSDFFWTLGPKGPNDPCSRRRGSQREREIDRERERVRGRHGGVEKRGGWNTSRMTPLPKRGFGPPSYGTFSTPLRCQCSVFPVQKSTTESAFSGTFSSPHTFCTPHITAQLGNKLLPKCAKLSKPSGKFSCREPRTSHRLVELPGRIAQRTLPY